MNQNLPLVLFLLFTIIFNGYGQDKLSPIFPVNEEKISPRLMDKAHLNDEKTFFYSDHKKYYHINITLKDKVDINTIYQKFNRQGLSIQKRSSQLIPLLKDKAKTSQKNLLSFLRNTNATDFQEESIKSLWITNTIFVKVNANIISKLSYLEDVEYIALNNSIAFEAYEDGGLSLNSPNGKEIGLVRVNAPAMWDLGYTGYGTKALVIDTGTDPTHPALSAKYWGHHVPNNQAWFDYDSLLAGPYPCHSHGTHVTGTILGLDRWTNDTIGVAFNASWMASPPIECPDLDAMSTLEILQTFQWSIDPDGNPNTVNDIPDVINNSWYDPWLENECNSPYIDMFTALEAVGVAVVFSAGNGGPGPNTISSPHNINTGIVNSFTVGALDGNNPNLPITNFSSRGPSDCGGENSLLIKPEVSAPGNNVRSCIPGDAYASFSGTSMAAPHTSGVILLLKEAFPSLTGEQLKLAVYFSAIDLGEEGEDNIYGMGAINALAAYNYLINEGHTPVPPIMGNDVTLIDVQGLDGIQCEDAAPLLTFENTGNVAINSILFSYEYSDGTMGVIEWVSDSTLAQNEQAFLLLPYTNLPNGAANLIVDIEQINTSNEDARPLNNRIQQAFRVLTTPDIDIASTATVCVESSALLTVNDVPENTLVEWYNQLTGGTLVGSGNPFTTPVLTETTNYYADFLHCNKIGAFEQLNQGSIDPAFEDYLVFDAYVPFTIKSVKVYAEGSGTRVIQLRNKHGQNIRLRPRTVADGEQRLELDFFVDAGTDYQLGVITNGNLYRDEAGANYPYEIENIASIHRSSDSDSDAYFYFYDWEIEYHNTCGRSEAIVEVGAGTLNTHFGMSTDFIDLANNMVVEFTDSTENAITWFWDFGDGHTSTEQHPTHLYEIVGDFTVTLQTTNTEGCTDATIQILSVDNSIGISPPHTPIAVQLYPNPTNGAFTIEFDLEKTQTIDIQIFDVLGRLLIAKTETIGAKEVLNFDISNFADGLYFVIIETEEGIVSKKLVK